METWGLWKSWINIKTWEFFHPTFFYFGNFTFFLTGYSSLKVKSEQDFQVILRIGVDNK